MNQLAVLDLFSAAAGGWSLGLHRAGFHTVAACEFIEWRRALYSQNNPGVRIYDNVTTLTGDELLRDLGFLPGIVVGSPPCQDVSSANTKGKGVEGERSGLYFEAIRIFSEIRDLGRERGEGAARWIALENSSNLRTRGADAVLAALEAIGYTCWAFVVSAGDIGANHERARSWIIGCDLAQVADPDGFGWYEGREGRRGRLDLSIPQDTGHANSERSAEGLGAPSDEGRDALGAGRLRQDANHSGGDLLPRQGDVADAAQVGHEPRPRDDEGARRKDHRNEPADDVSPGGDPDHGRIGPGHVCKHGIRWPHSCEPCDDAAYTDQARQANGSLEPSIRQAQEPHDGRGAGRSDDGQGAGQVGLCARDRLDALTSRADWSLDDLAHHLRVDAGLSAWVAQSRIAVGGKRGTSAASLIVEAFGDAVVPQIPEAVGRAILRTERALAEIYGRAAA